LQFSTAGNSESLQGRNLLTVKLQIARLTPALPFHSLLILLLESANNFSGSEHLADGQPSSEPALTRDRPLRAIEPPRTAGQMR
jgi:hypothetical protein